MNLLTRTQRTRLERAVYLNLERFAKSKGVSTSQVVRELINAIFGGDK